jgi:anion-transporting  ArsA/GET3 family ATPase
MVAAATASVVAQSGRKTLLASVGPSHSLRGLLGVELTSEPHAIAPALEMLGVDAAANVSEIMDRLRPRLPAALAQLSSDELPLIPGIDFFLCLEILRQSAAKYEMVVIDAGPHDALLRVLPLPDSLRWLTRILFGLDRGPGKNSASVNRAMLPTSLLPPEWINQIQEARMHVEEARDYATASHRTTVRYVLRPDAAALAEARLAVPAFHLHGLAVDALVVGPLLPADTPDTRLKEVAARQQAVTGEAERIWSELPVLRLPQTHADNIGAFTALGQSIYLGRRPDGTYDAPPPVTCQQEGEPFLTINLPGIQRAALSLTMSGDELIVQTGPYRRHILLPAAMRGRGGIKASREGERLIVRLRQ